MEANNINQREERQKILRDIQKSSNRRKSLKLQRVLKQNNTDLDEFRALTWNGISDDDPRQRSESWKILLGYIPVEVDGRQDALNSKREQYQGIIESYFGDFKHQSVADFEDLHKVKPELKELRESDLKNYQQILIDVIRTHPDLQAFQTKQVQCMLVRILFAFSQRSPDSEYVQGINDLCAPLLIVFMSEFVIQADLKEERLRAQSKNIVQCNRVIRNITNINGEQIQKIDDDEQGEIEKMLLIKKRSSVYDIHKLDLARSSSAFEEERNNSYGDMDELDEFSQENSEIDHMKIQEINDEFAQNLIQAEADTYWCLCTLIDGIKENYTEMQPGVHKILKRMKSLIKQADPEVLWHLEDQDIYFITFAYRWVSCYLSREFDLLQTIRLWDTYFSEEDGFQQFHCYVCAALFLRFSNEIKNMNFQDALVFLQNLPTSDFTNDDIAMLLAKSYEMKELYHFNTHLENQEKVDALKGKKDRDQFNII